MNTDLIVEILQLAMSLAEAGLQTKSDYSDVERTLISLVQTGAAAYHQHTGQPMDVSEILPEAEL